MISSQTQHKIPKHVLKILTQAVEKIVKFVGSAKFMN